MSLEIIKEEYAKDNLFNDWEDLENHGISDIDLEEIAELYAQQRVNEAYEKAAERIYNLKPFDKMTEEYKSAFLDAVVEGQEAILKLKSNEK